MFNAENTTPQQIIAMVQVPLLQIREAMRAAWNLHDWAAGVSLADLTALPPDGPGMDPLDAQAVLDACADAYGHMMRYDTGTDPRPNVPADYNYGASQKRVIGPRIR